MASVRWGRSQGTATSRLAHAPSGLLLVLIKVIIVCWSTLAACLALYSVLLSFSFASAETWGTTEGLRLRGAEHAGLIVNIAALVVAVGASIGIGLWRPLWWRRAILALAVIPLPLLTWQSGNAQAGLVVSGVWCILSWLGREIAGRMLREEDRFNAWALGSAFGLAFIAMVGFGLGSIGLLKAPILYLIFGLALIYLLLRARTRFTADAVALGRWVRSPNRRDPFTFMLGGVMLAYLWLGFCGSLTPETISDAVRVRTPVALTFAQTGRLSADNPELFTAPHPAVGEATYAVVLTLGSLATTKFLNFLVLLCALALVFALGRHLGGASSGLLAASIFGTMPLIFWLSQTAYLDLFLVVYALAAALLFCRAQSGWQVSVLAGACIGLGVGTKLHFGYMAVGLAVTYGLTVLRRSGLLAALRLVLLLAFVAGVVVAAPLARSYRLTGQFPGLALATKSLTQVSGRPPVEMHDLASFGYGRSVVDLLRVPLNLTINSHKFEWVPSRWGPSSGFTGYALLGILPFLALCLRRPHVFPLVMGVATAFLLWFYTAQYLRYGLPVFAICCPLAAVAFAASCRRFNSTQSRAVLHALLFVLLLAGVAVQLRVPNLSWGFALGQQDAATYLTRYQFCCDGYRLLQLLDAQPDATRAFVLPDPARLYTRVRMSSPTTLRSDDGVIAATSEAQALAALDNGGYSHVIISRSSLPSSGMRIVVVQEEFLRRNALLLDGENNTYLYRLLPPAERGRDQPWERGPELLADGGFEAQAGQQLPTWAVVGGSPREDTSGVASRSGRGALLVGPGDRVTTTVAVTAQTRYLLSHATRAQDEAGHAALWIEWRDAAGMVLEPAIEAVPTGSQEYHRFSLLATAPPTAATATVILEAHDAPIWFDDLSLRVATVVVGPGTARQPSIPLP